MIFTKNCAMVVPAGVFNEVLAKVDVVCRYPRRGGLHVATMKAKDPNVKSGRDGDAAPFAGLGAGR